MEDGIVVLSLFDGMSCGQQALERKGVKVKRYYASEIDKYAIQVTMANYPNTIQLGSVVDVDVNKLPKIDFFCGGSPCQSFSFAGKRKGMSTKCETEILTLNDYLQLKSEGYEFEGQSYLFWEYMRVLEDIRKINPNVKFLLENVMMGEKWQRVLTQAIGINPIEINSALVSAQNRRRLYWTNLGSEADGLFGDLVCKIQQPKDKGILLKDVLELKVDEKYYLSDKMIDCMVNHTERMREKGNNFEFKPTEGDGKAKILTTKAGSRPDDNFIIAMRGRGESGNIEQKLETNGTNKSNSLTTVQKDNLVYTENYIQLPGYRIDNQVFYEDGKHGTLDCKANRPKVLTGVKIRRLTPLECMRLQTVSDDYKMPVSDTQKYRMLGNGWTIDVIAHILSYYS